jgi:MFS transporter, DHA1 family, tetracycline resistance protein
VQTPWKLLSIVFAISLMDSIGFGIILPVMPQLIMEVTGEGLADAARWGGWMLFGYAIMQFLFAPLLGNLSDRFGRRRLLPSHSITWPWRSRRL